jgi:hypothetical protein
MLQRQLVERVGERRRTAVFRQTLRGSAIRAVWLLRHGGGGAEVSRELQVQAKVKLQQSVTKQNAVAVASPSQAC